MIDPATASADIDLAAFRANVSAIGAHVGTTQLMIVVKADGYGHGMAAAARAARAGGADWLGVALLDEALQLRHAGDTGPLLSWLAVPGERYDAAIDAGVDVSAYSVAQLAEIEAAARASRRRARVQLKLDSGLARGGATTEAWPALVAAARSAERAGVVEVTGVWSHLACSDEPTHPSVAAQLTAYDAGVAEARAAGLEPQHLHLANSAATMAIPAAWHTTVRPGIALYGVTPFADGTSLVSLRPAMRLHARLAMVKRVGAGQGVSYGHSYTTAAATSLALVPLGYGDGVPRHAGNRGPVQIRGQRFRIAGRVSMDQVVVDVGDLPAEAGDLAVLIGGAADGEPTAHDWAAAADTIGYEIVTRIGSRVPRRYVGAI